MKNLKSFFYIAFFTLTFAQCCWGTDTLDHTLSRDKLPLEGLRRNITEFQGEIEKAHAQVNYKLLVETNKKFKALNYAPREWEEIARDLKAEKWGDQNWKDVVGGHLFYPKNTLDLLDSPHTAHLIKRSDMIWGLAIAGGYNHPLGQLHFAYALKTSATDEYEDRLNDKEKEERRFIENLYQAARQTLEKCDSRPDACYVLGCGYSDYGHYGPLRVWTFDSVKEAREYFGRPTTDPRNKLHELKVRDSFPAFFEEEGVFPPVLQDYINLAKEKSYGPAYIEAARKADRAEEIIN